MTQNADQRERAFDILYDAHYSAVRAYAWRRDAACADDIVAETFLVAWKRLDDVPRNSALPWLLAVARNAHRNMQRAERRRSQREASLARLEPAAEPPCVASDEGDDRLLGLLKQLSQADQEVLLLVAWEGLDRPAIARVIGCSRTNVALRLHRARRRLRALLSQAAAGRATQGDSQPVDCSSSLAEGGAQYD